MSLMTSHETVQKDNIVADERPETVSSAAGNLFPLTGEAHPSAPCLTRISENIFLEFQGRFAKCKTPL